MSAAPAWHHRIDCHIGNAQSAMLTAVANDPARSHQHAKRTQSDEHALWRGRPQHYA